MSFRATHSSIRTKSGYEPFETRRPAFSALLSCLLGLFLLSENAIGAEATVHFTREILPLLSDNCFTCHGPDDKARKGKLRLDTKEGALASRDGRRMIVPGNSAESEVYKRLVTSDADELMPPAKTHKTLATDQIQKFKNWIDQGARWGEHWAFEPIKRPVIGRREPASGIPSHPIDYWVEQRLVREGLSFAPEAGRRTSIRRLSLDLRGLPPAPNEVSEFLNDNRPDAYERMVDRFLESPAYGERMAWDWLEASRYADSNGYQGDGERTMWPWRDWVVEAFNKNLPYDEFTIWQLAGDRLPGATAEQRLATGFCRNHAINGEGGRIAEENRVDYVMDMTETTGTVWLGLTFNCCRCHDHKYDPLSRRDYYNLFAFFDQTPVDGSGGDPQSKPSLEVPGPGQRERVTKAEAMVRTRAGELGKLELAGFARSENETADKSPAAAGLSEAARNILKISPEKRNRNQLADLEKEGNKLDPIVLAGIKGLREAIDERDRSLKAIPRVMVMEDMATPRKTYMLDKGIYDRRGEEVAAALPAKLAGPPSSTNSKPDRLELARWLVSPANPLTARVTVNRIWQQFFGIGLVKTAEDFGLQGEVPIHPELLDWLAVELQESGWNLKHLCKQIVTSRTYRQSSATSQELREKDPENRLLARGARFRMPSWMIRDQALAASGLLVPRKGGTPVRPYQPAGVWEEATFGAKKYEPDTGEGLYRRSLYTFWRRIIGPTVFFDTAPRQVCTIKPLRTNSPLHALVTLDDVTYVEAARVLAQEAILRGGRESVARVEWLYTRLLSRPPTEPELKIALQSLDRMQKEYASTPGEANKLLANGASGRAVAIDAVEHAAYTGFCSILLNLDETLTRE